MHAAIRRRALPLGSYVIREFAVEGTDPTGWALTSVVCNGKLVGSSQGAITVHLTADQPSMQLPVHEHLHAAATTEPEPEPEADTAERDCHADPDPVPVTDLHVTKTANRDQVPVGDTVTYTIKVKNVGKSAAQDVVLTEQTPTTNAKIVSVTLSAGDVSVRARPGGVLPRHDRAGSDGDDHRQARGDEGRAAAEQRHRQRRRRRSSIHRRAASREPSSSCRCRRPLRSRAEAVRRSAPRRPYRSEGFRLAERRGRADGERRRSSASSGRGRHRATRPA